MQHFGFELFSGGEFKFIKVARVLGRAKSMGSEGAGEMHRNMVSFISELFIAARRMVRSMHASLEVAAEKSAALIF